MSRSEDTYSDPPAGGGVDAETEYLSPAGWRKISEYDGGQVMEYDPLCGTGTYALPLARTVKPCTEFYRLHTKYGINQMLSADHRVLCWKITGVNRRRVKMVTTARRFAAEHNRLVQGFRAEFATVFAPVLYTKMDLSDEQIRVQVMVNADSAIVGSSVEVHVSKLRKVERSRLLLTAAGITFTECSRANGTTNFRFRPPLLSKSYAPFWEASADQLAVVADECLLWDGNTKERCFYTCDYESADFIQYAFTATGRRAVLRADSHYRDGRTDYRVFGHANTMVSMVGTPKTPVTIEASVGRNAYCFTLPSGFWVMRRNGNVAITGEG